MDRVHAAPPEISQFSARNRHMKSVPLTLPVAMDGELLRSVVREGKSGETSLHTHACGQLLYPEHGATLLETEHHLVRLGPTQAAWIPPRMPHAVLMERPYRYHSVYIDASLLSEPAFSVTFVSPLLRELILDAGRWAELGIRPEARHWKTLVIVEEIREAPREAAGVPIPDDPRIALICRALERDPADTRTLAEWATQAGASEKTLQRAFLRLTGQSFQQWRIHARMTKALELHRQGYRLLDIAVALGYSGEGAYAHAFRQFFGYSPGRLKKRGFASKSAGVAEADV